MRKFVFICLIFLLCLQYSTAEYITQEEIQQAGLLRLSDIFLLLNEWDYSTIDGITYQVSPLGLSSYQHQDWKVFLDGVPIDIDIFGTKSLDRIPIELSQIDYIRITSQPAVVAGQKAASGHIEIVTNFSTLNIVGKKAANGNTANFRSGFGNETGDPGPYFYTDKSTPNIDKVGNIIAGGLTSNTDSSFLNLFYKREIGYPTDQSMFYRNNAIADGYYPKQKLEAYYFDYGRKFYRSPFVVKAGVSEFDDFYYLRQYGREIPVNSKLVYLGSTGIIRPFLGFRFSYSSNEQEKRENSLDLDLGWKHETVRASIDSKYFWWHSLGGRFGLGFNHQTATSKYILNKATINETIIYGQFIYHDADGHRSTFDGLVNIDNNNVGYLFLSDIAFYFNNRNIFRSSFSYSKTLPSETNSLWYWQERGYNFLTDNNINYQSDGPIKSYKKFTVDISYNRQLNGDISMKIGGYYRYFTDLYCEGQFLISDYDFAAPNNLILGTDCSGQVLGGKLDFNFSIHKRLKLNLSGRYQWHVSDDVLFHESWDMVPRINLSGTVIYLPVNNFQLMSRIKYTGKTKWVDYDNTDNFGSGLHNYVMLDRIFSLDITAQKFIQKRRIRTSLSFRNLLNGNRRYHPIGAQFDLSYFAQIEILI